MTNLSTLELMFVKAKLNRLQEEFDNERSRADYHQGAANTLREKIDYLQVELDFRKAQLDDERNENSILKDRIKEALEWIDMHGDYRTAASVLRGDA